MNESKNHLFAKHKHSTEIIKPVWQEQKDGGSCSYIRRNEKKKKEANKPANKQISTQRQN